MKNKVRVLVIGIAILLLSYMIGQNIVLPLRSQENNAEGLVDANRTTSGTVSLFNEFDFLEKYGYKETEDNPWNKTIAAVDKSDDIPAGILLTSGTGIGVPLELEDNASLEIAVCIHPWMDEYSDGAVLQIEYKSDEEKDYSIIAQYKVKDSAIEKFTIDLSELAGTKGMLKITCPIEKSGDASGDWLLMTRLDVQYAQLITDEEQENKEYLRTVHYFADEWPINFWNCELTNMEKDFEQIRKDGFNSIILVIPWREFQPTLNPVSYNKAAITKLEEIMKNAGDYGLSVMVRVGYIWDYYEDTQNEGVERYYDVVGNPDVREAWYEYCAMLYSTLSEYSNFEGGFITWEDFWINVYLTDALQSPADRREWAKKNGFQEWLSRQYSMEELKKQYVLNVSDYTDIGIPGREDSLLELWYRYIDEFLIQLLEESQNHFPNLSMEVRTDWDVYKDASGETVYYKHDATYPCANSSYTSVMYGIPQGNLNQGERLHYEEALEKTKYILNSIANANQNKPIYIDQFLFADNTPGFEQNAQIYDDELEDYLMNVGDVLQKYTMGYAVWAYKDYAANLIYNPQFGKGLDGWTVKGEAAIESEDDKELFLHAGGEIEQLIPLLRIQYPSNEYTVSMDVAVEEAANLTITLGEGTINVLVPENGGIEVKMSVDTADRFRIKTDKGISIDNIKVYNHVQNGFLYDLEGNEQGAIAGMRYLNKSVTNNRNEEKK